jgi:hypothetical protein
MKQCPACHELTEVNLSHTDGFCDICGVHYTINENKNCYQGIQLKYTVEKKTCSVCKEEKYIDEFYRNTNSSDDHMTFCKKCTKQKPKKYVRKTRDKKGIPDLSEKRTLSAVLPHLIKISRKGYYADKILNDSLSKIKETLAEA